MGFKWVIPKEKRKILLEELIVYVNILKASCMFILAVSICLIKISIISIVL